MSLKTPIMAAVINNHYDIVKILIDNNADLKQVDANGATALTHAVSAKNDTRIAHLLIDAGSDINHKDNFGFSILHIVITRGHFEILQKLVEQNVNINSRLPNGEHPRDLAISLNRDNMIPLLSGN